MKEGQNWERNRKRVTKLTVHELWVLFYYFMIKFTLKNFSKVKGLKGYLTMIGPAYKRSPIYITDELCFLTNKQIILFSKLCLQKMFEVAILKKLNKKHVHFNCSTYEKKNSPYFDIHKLTEWFSQYRMLLINK